jgi:hypothetical protein
MDAAPNLKVSAIDPDTLLAYQRTEYRVLTDPPFTLTVAERSQPLADLQASHGASGSAFITACNPRSVRLCELENEQRQGDLAAYLMHAGLAFLHGVGVDPTGDWPGEPSFLVLGLTQDSAAALGQRFNQNAIMWSGMDAVPQLMLLR